MTLSLVIHHSYGNQNMDQLIIIIIIIILIIIIIIIIIIIMIMPKNYLVSIFSGV